MAAQSLGGLSLQGSRKGKLCFSGAFCIVEARTAFTLPSGKQKAGKWTSKLAVPSHAENCDPEKLLPGTSP